MSEPARTVAERIVGEYNRAHVCHAGCCLEVAELEDVVTAALLAYADEIRAETWEELERLRRVEAAHNSLYVVRHAPAQAFQEIEKLVAEWRERARLARPVESALVSAEKRERTKEWMFYTNRANELQAVLDALRAHAVSRPAPEPGP